MPPGVVVVVSERIQIALMTDLAWGMSRPVSRIASRLRCAVSRSNSWSAVVANESRREVTPHESSSTWKSAAVISGVSGPRARKTSARTRMRSRVSCAAAAIRIWSSIRSSSSGANGQHSATSLRNRALSASILSG